MSYSGLMFLHSGGVGNQSPNASLGGAASASKIAGAVSTQKVTNSTPITGIYIAAVFGNNLGSATIAFDFAAGTLSWTPSGQSLQSIAIGGDGVYKVGITYGLLFHLISSELPVSNASVNITVSDFIGNCLDDAGYTERQIGFTDYRCLYIKNLTGNVITALTLTTTQPTEATISFANEWQDLSGLTGVDVEVLSLVDEDMSINLTSSLSIKTDVNDYYYEAGQYQGAPYEKIGAQNSDGETIDLAVVIPTELDPTQIVSPLSWSSSLNWTNIGINKYVSFWMKRVSPAVGAGSLIHDSFTLTLTFTR